MPWSHYILGLLLSSPYLVGAAIVAWWEPGLGALIALGAVAGMAWLVGMGRAGGDN